MERIFTTHLFPDLSPSELDDQSSPRIPVLHSPTRREMYAVILSLSQNLESYHKLLGLVKDLVPQGRCCPTWSSVVAYAPGRLRVRSQLELRPFEDDSFANGLSGPQKPVQYMLPEFPLHSVVYERHLQRIHARGQHR